MSNSFAIPWTVASQAPLFVGSPRQKYWGRLPLPSPRGSSRPGDQTRISWLQVDSLLLIHQGRSLHLVSPGKSAAAGISQFWKLIVCRIDYFLKFMRHLKVTHVDFKCHIFKVVYLLRYIQTEAIYNVKKQFEILFLKYILIGEHTHNSHLGLTEVNYNLFNRPWPEYAEINFLYHLIKTVT